MLQINRGPMSWSTIVHDLFEALIINISLENDFRSQRNIKKMIYSVSSALSLLVLTSKTRVLSNLEQLQRSS